mmetsp:Transcript_32118/g.61854  ORF Transcript_32118/g.61854 Transcript_32118/m.61854 type:complete len:521 (-) Transcript_32118:302-1864(-)
MFAALSFSLSLAFLALVSTAVAESIPQDNDNIDANGIESTCKSSGDGTCTSHLTSVFVIGDLHGDAVCAISWVNRTGLIANLFLDDAIDSSSSSSVTALLYQKLNNPSQWLWTSPQSTLVFVGDYVDKGPTSKQTVQFVKDLTTAFPDRVTAILGNHELELLRDRDARIPWVGKYSAYSHATVHPGEYHNYFANSLDASSSSSSSFTSDDDKEKEPTDSPTHLLRPLDRQDDLVLDLLLEASMEVYAHNAHSAVRFVPTLPSDRQFSMNRGIRFAITDIIPPEHRMLAMERLQEYQDRYLNAFRSGTVLGDWLESRPIAHLAEDVKTLFVHGGVSEGVGTGYLSRGKESIEELNRVWWEHSHEGKLYDFLNGKGMGVDDVLGYVVYELLTYRGNHPGYDKWESHGTFDEDAMDESEVCVTLHNMLSRMDGIDRIAVGHTPDFGIRIMCNGAFLALDSMLGRWIRGSGNEYCPGPEHFEKRKGMEVPTTSRNGRYKCDEIKSECEGQIVRLDSDGSVTILD